jgi:hypothetical protein
MKDRELLRVAWFCWGAPAGVGIGVTILFLFTDFGAFAILGLLCALVGTILFAVGIAVVGASKTGPRLLLLCLLLSNFPLAFTCAVIGSHHADTMMAAMGGD